MTELCVCRLKLQTTVRVCLPDNLSLPLTHSLRLTCASVRKRGFRSLNLGSKTPSVKRSTVRKLFKNGGKYQSKQVISQLSDSYTRHSWLFRAKWTHTESAEVFGEQSTGCTALPAWALFALKGESLTFKMLQSYRYNSMPCLFFTLVLIAL